MTATNMTELRGENLLADEVLRIPRSARELRDTAAPPAGQDLVLGPLVDQVAYGFARVLVVAMKELEMHIANENRKLGDTVGERLGALQASFNELGAALAEQRAESRGLKDKCDTLESVTTSLRESDSNRKEAISALRVEVTATAGTISTRIDSAVTALQEADTQQAGEISSVRALITTEAAALRESDARQESDLAALRGETKASSASLSERIHGLQNEITVQQEDIGTIKSTLSGFNLRLDSVLERLDKQAEALHTMYTTYAQRESELEQLIEGLTRLRSVPAPTAAPHL